MGEISTKKIEIGEHVMIDGVEYVAKESGNNCDGCAFKESNCELIKCGDCIMVKVEKEDKDTPMTNQQLAEWLAKGHGPAKYRGSRAMFADLTFYEGEENEVVNEDLFIRPWGTDEWIKPTVEVYKRDCR